jgi:hypothetical protein
MKKIYILILLCSLGKFGNAQTSGLTKAANEPVIGDVERRKSYDSTTALPTNTGANQVWNFTSLATNTTAMSSNSYTTPSSISGGTAYPSATIGSVDGSGNSSFFKSTATQYELLGSKQSSLSLTFTNSAVMAVWPITSSYNNTDIVAGTAKVSTSLTLTGPFNGTINVMSTGTGTLMLPGSLTFANVLLVRSNLTGIATFTIPFVGTVTATIVNIQDQYYDASQKFPILNVSVFNVNSSMGNQSSKTITLNNDALVGIKENQNSDLSLNIFPNPASNQITIVLNDQNAENVSVQVMNSLGQVVKSLDLGKGPLSTPVNVSDLCSGMYYVKTNVGTRSSVKKLTIQ